MLVDERWLFLFSARRGFELLKGRGHRSWSVALSVADITHSIITDQKKTHSVTTLAQVHAQEAQGRVLWQRGGLDGLYRSLVILMTNQVRVHGGLRSHFPVQWHALPCREAHFNSIFKLTFQSWMQRCGLNRSMCVHPEGLHSSIKPSRPNTDHAYIIFGEILLDCVAVVLKSMSLYTLNLKH